MNYCHGFCELLEIRGGVVRTPKTPCSCGPGDGGEKMERGTKPQRGGEGRSEWNRSGEGWGPLAEDGGLYLDICIGFPEFQVTPY